MVEETKAELYLAYLDRVLAGEKDIGPVEDTEVAELLRLAQIMITVDISVNSEIRDSLQKQLLERISQADHWVLAGPLEDNHGLEDELTDEELQYAAAGLQGQAVENICPRCGTRFSRLQGKCPVCR
jgi:hypothetical protein